MEKRGPKPGTPKQPGSGRKAGTPNKIIPEIRLIARAYGPEAIETIVKLMRKGELESTRFAAAKELADRGYGKATQYVATPPDEHLLHKLDDRDLATLERILAKTEESPG